MQGFRTLAKSTSYIQAIFTVHMLTCFLSLNKLDASVTVLTADRAEDVDSGPRLYDGFSDWLHTASAV